MTLFSYLPHILVMRAIQCSIERRTSDRQGLRRVSHWNRAPGIIRVCRLECSIVLMPSVKVPKLIEPRNVAQDIWHVGLDP